MTSLAGIELEHPLMNAAGTCKTVEEAAGLVRSAVSAVVVGSVTVHARSGNAGQTYHGGPSYSLNALGLPNPGMEYYRRRLPEIADMTGSAGKPLVVSVAGFDVQEYATMAYEVALTGANLVELNLACPNLWDTGTQKRIVCFDVPHSTAICAAVDRALVEAVPDPAHRPRFGVKISPFSDPVALAAFATQLAERAGHGGGPAFVTTANTFPNAVAFDSGGRPVIDVGLAGLGGAALKPVALGQVCQLRSLLPDTIDIVGVGGVASGRDVRDYLGAGACAVGVATAFWDRGGDPRIFGDILASYAELA